MSAAIGSIMARISAIENRFTPADASDPTLGAVPVLDEGTAFDAFGATYQNALATRSAVAASPATSWMSPSFQPGSFAPMNSSFTVGSAGASGPGSAIVNAAINGVAAAPGERQVGGYGELPIPAAVAGFGNGQVPRSALTPLSTQPGHKLYAPAAASWNSLVATARSEGIDLKITDSYRDYDEQVDLARRKGLYAEGGLAARPGTSIHGWGMAVDANVNDPRTLQWLKTNGPRFGWVEAVPREPWHWEFRPDQV